MAAICRTALVPARHHLYTREITMLRNLLSTCLALALCISIVGVAGCKKDDDTNGTDDDKTTEKADDGAAKTDEDGGDDDSSTTSDDE